MRTLKVALPAGIGDVSWMWSKLVTIPDTKWELFVPDGYPQRTRPFLDLLEGVKGGIGVYTYNDIVMWERSKQGSTLEDVFAQYDEGDTIYLQINHHLGHGKPLADWYPEVDTDFHYKLNFKKTILPHDGNFRIGIATASMRGIRAWNAWMPETWVEFMRLVRNEFRNIEFYLLGGYWDIDAAMEVLGNLPGNIHCVDLVGKTDIHQICSILEDLDYYIGFSSGLNVLRNVLDKPGATLWPKHQYELMYSWPDPKTVERRDYMGFVYDTPERIFSRVRLKLREIHHERTERELVGDSSTSKV